MASSLSSSTSWILSPKQPQEVCPRLHRWWCVTLVNNKINFTRIEARATVDKTMKNTKVPLKKYCYRSKRCRTVASCFIESEFIDNNIDTTTKNVYVPFHSTFTKLRQFVRCCARRGGYGLLHMAYVLKNSFIVEINWGSIIREGTKVSNK